MDLEAGHFLGSEMMEQNNFAMGRRALLRLAINASVVAVPWQSVRAQTAAATEPTAPIRRFNEALLAAMQSGRTTTFSQRFATLTPVIEQTFDLDSVLAVSVGPGWAEMPETQKAPLRATFIRYTVASYAANFDTYAGQTFQLSPTVRMVGDGRVIVQTRLVSADGSAMPLNYLMRNGQSGWKAVDVLADGSISRVAVQRSDFRDLLRNGGVPALITALRQKVVTLSGGMLA
jgi:phospholipid transport system substrate-binding protein